MLYEIIFVSNPTQALPYASNVQPHSWDLVHSWGLLLPPAGDRDTVLVARGSSAKPIVERVVLPTIAAEPASVKLKPQQVSIYTDCRDHAQDNTLHASSFAGIQLPCQAAL